MKKIEKLKNLKKLTKVAIVLTIFLTATIVTAGLISYFAEIQTELDIETSVTIDNHVYTDPIIHNLELQSGNSISVTHTVRNRAKTCNVMINQITTGLIEGVTLRYYDEDSSRITFPFRLNASSAVVFTMIYHADINLPSQKVNPITKFSVVEL